MEILADVDGVLLNWFAPFQDWMIRKGYPVKMNTSYDMHKCFGISEAACRELILEFNSSANIGFLPPLPATQHWLNQLHAYHGITFHCISSMGGDVYAKRLREYNLQNLFGKTVISSVTILGCGEDKTEALSNYKDSNMIWLEDHIDNANIGAALGLRSYLFNRPYNKPNILNEEKFTRVNSWAQLYQHIKNIV